MAIRFSTELLNKAAEGYGVRELLRDGRLYVYTGGQPASANTAPSTTLLGTYTVSSGSYTSPVQSQAKIVISGSTGSLDTVKVGGSGFDLMGGTPVTITSGALGTSADNIAAQINATMNPLNITAASDSVDTITLSLPYWLGAGGDGLTLATTETTSTVTINGGSSSTFGGAGSPQGGTTAVNGLNFLFPAVAGVLTKTADTWSCSAAATGTAGWFRFVAGGSTVDGTGGTDVRFDGDISTSGADLNLSSTAFTSGATQTITEFYINVGQ